MSDEGKRKMKPLEEMDVIDDFLFTEIASDKKLGEQMCGLILKNALKMEIRHITVEPQRTVPGISEDARGIRIDAYIKGYPDDGTGELTVYDIEPDKRKAEKDDLPKRSRYYGDLIDSQLLAKGKGHKGLENLVILFILSYDPFGAGSMYYEVRNGFITHKGLSYDDGIRRIYLYTDGKLPDKATDADRRLQNLLKYIRHSTKENVTDEDTKKLDDIVRKTKESKWIGVRYMKSWELLQEAREDGIEEGREEQRRMDEEQHRADAEQIAVMQEQMAAQQAQMAALQAEIEALREQISARG